MNEGSSIEVMNDSTACVFVLGAPRSGTSVLAWAIAQHSKMWTSVEMDFPFYFCRDGKPGEIWRLAAEREEGWLREHEVSQEEFMASVGGGLDALILRRSGGLRWIDSTNANTLHARTLSNLFPGAQFVHIIRDGRAVVSSLMRSGFEQPATQDFTFACRTWVDYVQGGREANEAMPGKMMEIRQEAMQDNPDEIMKSVQQFLNLENEEGSAGLLRSGRINSSYGNQSPGDVRMPKPASLIPHAPWRDWSEEERTIFGEIAGELMTELGYDPGLT